MTPQEKAKDLLAKMLYNTPNVQDGYTEIDYIIAKKSAIVCVCEISEALSEYDNRNETYELQNMDGDFRFWDKVKQELQKL